MRNSFDYCNCLSINILIINLNKLFKPKYVLYPIPILANVTVEHFVAAIKNYVQ